MPTLKHSKALSFLAEQIGEAVSQIVDHVFDDLGRDDLKGREETVTPQIARELTAHLFSAVKERLNGQRIFDVTFKVHCFKHAEEKEVGADIAGTMTIRDGQQSLTKVYLAQAKVAGSARMKGSRNAIIRAGDQNLLRQCGDMLSRSSSSYVFVYSKFGVHVVPATAIRLKGKGQVDTSTDYYRSLKMFYTEFFKCFVGDVVLGAKLTAAKNVNDVFQQLKVANGLAITAELTQPELLR